ncbi:MAG: thioredoxin [Candidatus Aminicenantes bacterium]|nr:thioredoxin [Candidatus Aminicenantes bacterium]
MSNVKETNEQTFEAEVLKSEKPVVVDFWAPWCGPCRMMGPMIDEAAKKFEGSVEFRKLNTDENGGIAMSFNIMAIPTLIVFNGGKEVDRIIGLVPPAELESKLKALTPASA